MPRPKTHDDALRVRLLDRAGELLSEQGAEALSLRKLAAEVQTSTTAVYSLFGGKPGLIRELYVEAFRRFGGRLQAVERTDDPAADLIALGVAYRESALADPHLYSIMFANAVPGFEPDDEASEEAMAAFTPLVEAVRAGIAAGVLRDVVPETIALASWGLTHGLVSLELGGRLPDGLDVASQYEAALRAHVAGWSA